MSRLAHVFHGEIDSRVLAIARIIMALAALFKILVQAPFIRSFFAGDGDLLFPYPIESVIPRSDTAGLMLIVLWVSFGALFLLGLWTRVAGAGLAIVILAVITVDQQVYSNHLYLMAIVIGLLALADAGARYSLDAWNNEPRQRVPRWPATLLKLQLTSVYLFAALSKLNAGFLEGTIFEISFDPDMRERIESIISLETLAMLAIATELFLAVAFWIPAVRWGALVIGLGFHCSNVLIMERGGSVNLAIFALMMLSLMLIFFDDWFSRSPAPDGEAAALQPEDAHATSTAG